MKVIYVVFLLLAWWIFSCIYSAKLLAKFPEEHNVKGSLCTKKDKDFVGMRYSGSVPYCKRRVSTSTRRELYKRGNIDWKDRKHYTIDHFYPLALGGSNHMDNLRPEHLALKMKRGSLENDLYLAVLYRGMLAPEARWIIKYAKTHKRDKRYTGDLSRYTILYLRSILK